MCVRAGKAGVFVILVLLAGCIGSSVSHTFNGIPTEPPARLALAERGFLVLSLEGGVNVSLVRATLSAMTDDEAPRFSTAFLFLDGLTLVPTLQEREPLWTEGLDVGAQQQGAAPMAPTPSAREMNYSGAHFTEETRGIFLVAWSGLQAGAQLELRWLRGTRVSEITRGDDVVSFGSRDMEGTRLHAQTIGVDVDRRISFSGSSEQTLLGVIETPTADLRGDVAVTDASGERATSLVVEGANYVRTMYTAEPDMTIHLTSDSSAALNGLVARLPSSAVASREWTSYAGSDRR